MFLQKNNLPDELWVKKQEPLPRELANRKANFDEEIKRNLLCREKFVVACGPCSADNVKAVSEYVRQLKRIAESCPDLLVIARIYTTKPHSNSVGYRGMCFGQNQEAQTDFTDGILACRKMMIDCLDAGLPVADELLYPSLYKYFDDLVSYWFVGARSGENAIQRDFASGLNVCCGIKNGTDGNIEKLIDSVQACSCGREFPFEGAHVVTDGNKLCHVVLRGGFDGQNYLSNIEPQHTAKAKELLKKKGLSCFVMADLSHANSGKIAKLQVENVKKIAADTNVDGAMAESYLFEGKSDNTYGVSRTDECVGIGDTQTILSILQQGFEKRK